MKPALSPAQSRALALAAEYGRLIRLRGGFWVTQHFADCETRTPKRSEYAGTQTVNALKERGLLTLSSNGIATLTELGSAQALMSNNA
ncbi:conserved hypothetical protein [Oceanicaulis sp. 350]|jgi:hypothetical protein|nr:hypothetical protein [Oceanicaulis sp.]VXD01212.1 conserved hypothetical protein [Oceanicaulis sp. 350]